MKIFWPGTEVQRYKAQNLWKTISNWARNRGTEVHSSNFLAISPIYWNFCWKLTKVQRYTGTEPKICQRWSFFGQVQRYKGTQLKICERKFQIEPDTEVQRYTARISLLFHWFTNVFAEHCQRYRGTQIQNPKSAKDENFLARYRGTKVHSSKFVKENFKLGQIQRYKGTQLEFICYFIDLLDFLLKIVKFTEVHRYRARNLSEMKLFWPGTEVQRYTAQNNF